MRLSRCSIDALVEYETGGKAYYEKRLAHPTWPGGESGVTVGVGFDLGHSSRAEIAEAWRPVAEGHRDTASVMRYLLSCQGVRGPRARALAEKGAWLRIAFGDALDVFNRHTLAREVLKTRTAFPGVSLLPPDAQGALLSLVYNRGPSLAGEGRREMRAIASTLFNLPHGGAVGSALAEIAGHIRAMKRLWEGQALDGLLKRRDAEADMVAGAERKYSPDEIVEVDA